MLLVSVTKSFRGTSARHDPDQHRDSEADQEPGIDPRSPREEPDADRQEEQQVEHQGSCDALPAPLILHEPRQTIIAQKCCLAEPPECLELEWLLDLPVLQRRED